jgi:hypothetical protein
MCLILKGKRVGGFEARVSDGACRDFERRRNEFVFLILLLRM